MVDLRLLWVVAPLAFGLGAMGCSDSGGSGSSRSTASGSTAGILTSTGGGGGAPSTSSIPAAPASVAGVTGEQVFNEDLQHAWDRLAPELVNRLNMELQAQAGSIYSRGAIDVEVRNLSATNTNMLGAPGFTHFANDRLVLRIPQNGAWELVVEGDVRVTLAVGSFSPHYDIPIKISITNLSLEVEVEFDHADPTRPVLSRVGAPVINFNVQIDSTSSLLAQVTPILTPLADYFAHRALNNALGGILPTLSNLQGMPGPVPGAGAPPLADSGVATPFAEIMGNIDAKIRRDHLPHGLILGAVMDTPASDSWESAYVNGGSGNPGSVDHHHSGGDAAIWTGQYLASQAFSYNVTRDPSALSNVKHALGGIGKLLDGNGGSGLLARNAAPVGSLVEQRMNGIFRTTLVDGVYWSTIQAGHGISRDQYMGVFWGLSLTYDLVDDPIVRTKCQRRLEMMLDYLLANDWVITEDRPALGTTARSRGPLFWAGIGYQQVTHLLAGHRMNPAKYAAPLAAQGPISETAWLGAWGSVLSVGHYYKFNLSHTTYHNYFRLETDQQRWQDFHRAYLILRRYVGHHRNAHFDLIASTIDPSLSAVFFPQTRELMRGFLKRNRREAAPAVVDLTAVTFVPVTQSVYQNVAGGSVTLQTTTTLMPSEPLDVELRKHTGNFAWQRDPFTPNVPNQGNVRSEKHGLDAVLPYWMGRFLGAF